LPLTGKVFFSVMANPVGFGLCTGCRKYTRTAKATPARSARKAFYYSKAALLFGVIASAMAISSFGLFPWRAIFARRGRLDGDRSPGS
jgi:hypothetical protein